MGKSVTPRFFATAGRWRAWLAANHATTQELWVGFHKKATGRPSITWPESVDQALCYGWIDGLRKSVDANSYMIRFTPRRKDSNWSAVNLKRARELIKQGLMRAPGLRAFGARKEGDAPAYSFEQRRTVRMPPTYLKEIRANAPAWAFFRRQPPWYQRTCAWYVISAKRKETRRRRLGIVIRDSAAGRRIGILERPR
ncbi:MAG TPA: YdeI/OmpD-associated family protein [Gemmatimonadales bacterium]|nr:YdeI/OmpD-associated family protein [Gemmatimonadales bacterium]